MGNNKQVVDKILSLDRRFIFLALAICTVIPLFYPLDLKVSPTKEVKSVYNYIENLPEGSAVLLSFDFDPSSKPELEPMAYAVSRHVLHRNLKLIGMNLWLTGTDLAANIMTDAVEYENELREKEGKPKLVDGKDWAFLGFMPGFTSVIIGMGESISDTYPEDYHKNKTKDMELFKKIKTLKHIAYVVDFAAGPTIESWYMYGKDKYKFELGGGCTAVSAAGLYPLVDTKQINGLIGGMRGAAEYERLMKFKGDARKGMDAQSVTHFLIVFFIILCNALYLIKAINEGK